MLKRNLILGGLIAGAFVLPGLAVAGSVSGVCSNCHTMHNSQNGAGMLGMTTGSAAKANLLAGTGCVGCHAKASVENVTGAAAGAAAGQAPQVDGDNTATTVVLNGGYFNTGTNAAANARQHNIAAISTRDALLGYAPPGGTLLDPKSTGKLSCENCHSASGHHATAIGKYRMLEGTNQTSASAQTSTSSSGKSYGAKTGGAAVASGDRQQISYDATAMNLFCANCHGNFHTQANQDAGGASGTQNTWVRHPTDIAVTNGASAPSIMTLTSASTSPGLATGVVVVGKVNGAGTSNIVMCLSCHVPHGGPFADLLSYNYSASSNAAGDGTRSAGCETCHNYGTGGM